MCGSPDVMFRLKSLNANSFDRRIEIVRQGTISKTSKHSLLSRLRCLLMWRHFQRAIGSETLHIRLPQLVANPFAPTGDERPLVKLALDDLLAVDGRSRYLITRVSHIRLDSPKRNGARGPYDFSFHDSTRREPGGIRCPKRRSFVDRLCRDPDGIVESVGDGVLALWRAWLRASMQSRRPTRTIVSRRAFDGVDVMPHFHRPDARFAVGCSRSWSLSYGISGGRDTSPDPVGRSRFPRQSNKLRRRQSQVSQLWNASTTAT